jgi:N-acetyl-1-D-myo-inositol-2-amino-2-deoxy-alpha-D-glucopyranoside deacetylase
MEGTPENDDPRAFVKQDPDEAIARIAGIIRETAPNVLITYNEFGFYGHPDHIRAHEVAVAAASAAANPAFRPEQGFAHGIAKLYYSAVPRSLLLAGRELAEQFGQTGDDFFSLDEIDRVATADDSVTTWIDVAGYVERKFHALEAHRTQLGTTERFLQIPENLRATAMGTEHYVLVRPDGAAHREADLFEGVRV